MSKIFSPRILLIIAVFTCTSAHTLFAQQTYSSGVLPLIGLTTKITDQWRVTLRLESRQQLISGFFGSGFTGNYSNVLTDFLVIPTRKVGVSGTAGAGYMLRTRNGLIYHRAIQQYSVASSIRSLLFYHRISADQTFSAVENTEYRLRYRLGTELPFSGLSIDDREFYWKITNEVLQKLQNSAYDLENRFVAVTGYQFSDRHRLEYGLDYRIGAILSPNTKHTFWWQLNWQISL